jgi:hypothetical protein
MWIVSFNDVSVHLPTTFFFLSFILAATIVKDAKKL